MDEKTDPDESNRENHTIDLDVHDVPPKPVKNDDELGKAHDLQTEYVMPEEGQAEGVTIEDEMVPSRFTSFWGKAKETLTEVSEHTTIAGSSLASKGVTLSTRAAAKTSEITKQTLSASAEITRSGVEAGKQAYEGSRIKSTLGYLDSELEQHGVKQVMKKTSAAVGGKLDEVTGKRLLELVEQRLQLQDYYNDVLASRLAEAIERIGHLEAQLTGLKTAARSSEQNQVTVGNADSTRRQP